MQQAGAKILRKASLTGWLSQLIERHEVIAPVAGHAGDILFSRVTSPQEVVANADNPLNPPKQFLLPPTDPIIAIRDIGDGYHIEPIHDHRQRVIFNIRSCDVKGIKFLTSVHVFDLVDTSYVRRAENTILISLACNVPCADGFCICTDSGPFLQDGHDLQLTDLGDRLFVESGSEKGRSLLDTADAFFQPANEEDIAQRLALEKAARGLFGERTCHFASAMRRISGRRVPEALWDEMADWCLECGACTMVCPTCYCFSIKDRRECETWVRCRISDSCQYAAFTLEASGHNPRAERKDRMKRRFFHKVSAEYYRRDEAIGCVGCGRCIRTCLGAADMPTVVAALRRGAWRE